MGEKKKLIPDGKIRNSNKKYDDRLPISDVLGAPLIRNRFRPNVLRHYRSTRHTPYTVHFSSDDQKRYVSFTQQCFASNYNSQPCTVCDTSYESRILGRLQLLCKARYVHTISVQKRLSSSPKFLSAESLSDVVYCTANNTPVTCLRRLVRKGTPSAEAGSLGRSAWRSPPVQGGKLVGRLTGAAIVP